MELIEIVDSVSSLVRIAGRQNAEGKVDQCRQNLVKIKDLLTDQLVGEDEKPATDEAKQDEKTEGEPVVEDETPAPAETPEKPEAAAGPEKTVSQEDKLD